MQRHTAQTGLGEVRGDFLPFFCGAGFPGRSCQADGAQCGLPLLGGRAGFSWGGSRGRTHSHEPLQWALQGVFGAPLPPGGCLAPWGAHGVSLGVRDEGSPSRTCLPTRPFLPPPGPLQVHCDLGGRIEAGTGPKVAFTCRPSLGADEASSSPS